MPVKLKLGNTTHPILWKLVRAAILLIVVFAAIGAAIFGYYYHEYRGLVDDKLAKGPLFASVSQVYAAPQEVRPGQQLSATSIAAALRRAGYDGNTQLGSYELRGNSILIKPGPQSYLAMDGATTHYHWRSSDKHHGGERCGIIRLQAGAAAHHGSVRGQKPDEAATCHL